jgi:hypothetical protein
VGGIGPELALLRAQRVGDAGAMAPIGDPAREPAAHRLLIHPEPVSELLGLKTSARKRGFELLVRHLRFSSKPKGFAVPESLRRPQTSPDVPGRP